MTYAMSPFVERKMGIGDWGLGIGPNPQSPIPNPHEFKTPLITIIYILKNYINKDKQSFQFNETTVKSNYPNDEYINNTIDLSDYMLSLINDMADYSIIDLKYEFRCDNDEFDFYETLNFAYRILKILIDCKGLKEYVTPILEIGRNVPRVIYSDEKRIKQLLLNLISNSIKFTKYGSIKIITNIAEGDHISISVEDTGIGIKKEDIPLLFNDYSKLNNRESLEMNKIGSGLGLSICKKIIGKIGRDLTVESTPYQKTVFNFVIFNKKVTYPVSRSVSQNYIASCLDNGLIPISNQDSIIDSSIDYKTMDGRQPNFTQILKSSTTIPDVRGLFSLNKRRSTMMVGRRFDYIDIRSNINIELVDHMDVENSNSKGTFDADETIKLSLLPLYKLKENDDLFKIERNNFQLVNTKESPTQVLKPIKNLVKYLSTSRKSVILIADDNKIIRNSLKNTIRSLVPVDKYNVITCKDGIDLLTIITLDQSQGNKVKLVISDENMTFLDGSFTFNLLQNLYNQFKVKFVPFVLCTAQNELSNMTNTDYYRIAKPPSKIELRKLICKLKI